MSKAEVIHAWPMRSDRGVTTYEVILRADGEISCDCPGWVYKSRKKIEEDGKRSCKHTDRVEAEAAQILAKHQAGARVTFRKVDTPDYEPVPSTPRPARRIVIPATSTS